MKKILVAILVILSLSTISIASNDITLITEDNFNYNQIENIISRYENEDEIVYNPYTEPDIGDFELDVQNEYSFDKDDIYLVQDNITYTDLKEDGNVYLVGKNVILKDCQINGNIFVAAEKIEFNNVIVNGSIYLAGEKVKLNVQALDMYIAGSEINIENQTYIYRTIRIAGEEINLSGEYGKNCYLAGKKINLNEANIHGNLKYYSENEADIDGSNVFGEILFERQEEKEIKVENKKTFADYFTIGNIISRVVNTAIIGGFILLICKKFVNVNQNGIAMSLSTGLGLGILGIMFIPCLIMMLIVTIVGIPVSLLILIFFIIGLSLGTPVISLSIASNIVKREENASKWKVLGFALVISIMLKGLESIPVIRWIFKILFGIIGLGILLKTFFTKEKNKTDIIM